MSDAMPGSIAGPDESFESLETERLTIRRFRPEDAGTFAAYRSDPEVARYQGWEAPFTEEQAQRFVIGLERAHPDTPGDWFQFALVERATGTHVGDLAAGVDVEDPSLATVGFTVAPAHQGRGLGAEALTALLHYLLVDRGKRRVIAECDARNAAAAALLERVGMRREAHHRQSAWWKGEWTDEYVYAVLATEWPVDGAPCDGALDDGAPGDEADRARRRSATPADRGDVLERLADELSRVAAETRFSGVVRVDQGEATRLAEAFGSADRAHGVANTVGTRFGTASITKGLTALTVVRLIEEGLLSLGTTARSVLGDDLPLVADEVSVEHLLAHRSGIGDYLDEEAGWEPTDHVLPVPVHELATLEDHLRVLDGFPMKAAPGERFSYCNSGYVVLALLAERVSGTPFHELVEEQVCRRAGMHDTAFLRSDELPGGAARGYLDTEGLRTNVLHLPVRGGGDGGAYSTAADLHALWTAFFAGRIVGHGWVQEMVRPRSDVPAESMRYGLGFWLDPSGDQVVLEGYDAGVSARSVHDPASGTTATVLSNTSAGAWPIARLLHDRLPLA